MPKDTLARIATEVVDEFLQGVHETGGGLSEQLFFVRELRRRLETTELGLKKQLYPGGAAPMPTNVIPFPYAQGG